MPRRTEFDLLRGALLLGMALTHLPTRASAYADQPLGFISSAEGFVFLSAFIAGGTYARLLRERGPAEMRRRARKRTLQLYLWHLSLMVFAFTAVAALAIIGGRPVLKNLLSFYLEQPLYAIAGGVVLLYEPPLFDILPMYIVFLLLTPWVLRMAQARGWSRLLVLSGLIWLFAQLDGRALVFEGGRLASGWPLPIESMGAFDWFAWQLAWMAGLWLGARDAGAKDRGALAPVYYRPQLLGLALGASMLFFLWRHRLGGWSIDLGSASFLLDKWHLGLLRLLNFAALALLVSLILPALARLRIEVLEVMGRASLPVFASHLVICVLSLGLVDDDRTPLNSLQEVAVVALALTSMLFVAWRATPREPAAARAAPEPSGAQP